MKWGVGGRKSKSAREWKERRRDRVGVEGGNETRGCERREDGGGGRGARLCACVLRLGLRSSSGMSSKIEVSIASDLYLHRHLLTPMHRQTDTQPTKQSIDTDTQRRTHTTQDTHRPPTRASNVGAHVSEPRRTENASWPKDSHLSSFLSLSPSIHSYAVST